MCYKILVNFKDFLYRNTSSLKRKFLMFLLSFYIIFTFCCCFLFTLVASQCDVGMVPVGPSVPCLT